MSSEIEIEDREVLKDVEPRLFGDDLVVVVGPQGYRHAAFIGHSLRGVFKWRIIHRTAVSPRLWQHEDDVWAVVEIGDEDREIDS